MDEDAAQAQALAGWLGAHAVEVFSAALVCLLLLAGVASVGIRRYGTRVLDERVSRNVVLFVSLALGAGIVAAAAAVFVEAMEALDAEEEIGLFDSYLALTLSRDLSVTTLRVFGTLTHFGDPVTLTLLVAGAGLLLLVRGQRAMAFGWVLACAGGGLLNRLLKQIFERVRPVHDHGFAVADGFSFPSGHTSGAVVVYGMLAWLCIRLLPAVWHLPAVLLATALAFSTGWSRVFLQVHWASDVIAGFASGLAWLTVCIVAMEIARRRPRST